VVASGRVIRPKHIGPSSLRYGPFYTVASVELGNSTTKCILMSTNLESAEVFEIEKEVRMTRDIRPPKDNEVVFGKTLVGVPLSKEAVSEFINDIITTVLKKARIRIESDLHFVVRSTGVNASFASPSEVGAIVKSLADGCLDAGIPPRKMTASLAVENLPPGLRDYSWLKKVYFDGAVAASLPPAETDVVANEMEGELVTAGLKGAAKSTNIDFRNPVMTLDFGTTLAGRITDNSFPYAKTVGSFAGLAGAIPDAIVQGTSLVEGDTGCTLDLATSRPRSNDSIDEHWVERAHRLIRVGIVPKGSNRFGTVPVNTKAAENSGLVLIGVDVGDNGSELGGLKKLGSDLEATSRIDEILIIIDNIQAHLVQRIVSVASSANLILPETSLGLTGRAITTGTKPRIISKKLRINDKSWTDTHHLLFVEDGLAIGAAVAARCMNSLGTRTNPMGGRKGDGCIMGARMNLQKK